MYEILQAAKPLKVKQDEELCLEVIGGGVARTLGSALKTPDQKETVLLVMNLTDEPHTLYRGTRIGEGHAITKCDHVGVMLPAQSGYFDDSKNSRVEYRPATPLKGRTAFRPQRVDVRMDPLDLPDHLEPLIEAVANNLAIRKREELAAAIYEYQDFLAMGLQTHHGHEEPRTYLYVTQAHANWQARD